MIPENMSVLLYDQFDVNKMSHTSCLGFWEEQEDRFEVVKNKDYPEFNEDNPGSSGIFFFTDRYLEANIIYNWYISTFGVPCAILWDLAFDPTQEDGSYCVWVGVPNLNRDNWHDKYKSITEVVE